MQRLKLLIVALLICSFGVAHADPPRKTYYSYPQSTTIPTGAILGPFYDNTQSPGAQDRNITWFNFIGYVTGGVDARLYSTLALADAAAASAGKQLVISTVWNTVPSTLSANIKVLPGGGLNNSGPLTINGPFSAGLFRIFTGAGAVTFGAGAIDAALPEWFSTTGGVVAAIKAANGTAKVVLGKRAYVEPTGLVNNVRGVIIEGSYGDRAAQNGSEIQFTGTGTFFDNGTDNGHLYDVGDYDGPQGVEVWNVDFRHTAPDTGITASPGSQYKAGAIAIRDWRGGDIKLKNVTFENFDTGFWGIQSDVNDFDNIQIRTCNVGIYLGPRSDQITISKLYATLSNQAIIVDRASGTRLMNPQIVGCGTSTLYPIEIRQGTGVVNIVNPWFEHYQGYAGTDQAGFVGAGLVAGYNSTTTPALGILISNPIIATTAGGSAYHTKCVVGLGAALYAKIQNPSMAENLGWGNLDALVIAPTGTAYNNTQSGIVVEMVTSGQSDAQIFANNGTGTPHVEAWQQGANGSAIENVTGRFSIKRFGGAAGIDELRISNENSSGFVYITAPTKASGQKDRLFLWKSLQQGTAAPISGAWESGDRVMNIAPAVGQPKGWVCTVGGTPGTWVSEGNL